MPLLDRLLALVGLDFDVDLATDRISPLGPRRFLGERPVPGDVHALTALGITHVVSCLEPDDRPTVAFLDDAFATCFVPVRDSMRDDLLGHFPTVAAFVDAAEGGVLVHCQRGVSRSGAMAIALHMRDHDLGFLDAFRAVQAQRPGVLPNLGFASQLQRLERERLGAREGPRSLATYLHAVCQVPLPVDVLDEALADHDDDAVATLLTLFGGDIPRVVQGVRR